MVLHDFLFGLKIRFNAVADFAKTVQTFSISGCIVNSVFFLKKVDGLTLKKNL